MCSDCKDKILNPLPVEQPYCDQCAEENSICTSKFPAECVTYHMFDTSPASKLTNLGIPNKTSISLILEKIDERIGSLDISNSNVSVADTATINMHTLSRVIKADVKISATENNQLQAKDDGLFVTTLSNDGKVKVSPADIPDYLKNQLVGGSDGISSVTVEEKEGLMKFTPTLNIVSLLNEIRTNHSALFNQLVAGSSTTYTSTQQQSSKFIPYVPYPYFGPIDVFDQNGVGIAEKGFSKIYVCNGQNGTPDIRGRVIAGANSAVPGGQQMDNEVDPSLPQNADYVISKGTKKGSFVNMLTTQNLAPHIHPVIDLGHAHDYTFSRTDQYGPRIEPDKIEQGNDRGIYAQPKLTNKNTTGITVGSSGEGTPHNITQPTIGAVYMMYIP